MKGDRGHLVAILVLALILAGANLFWTSHTVNANQAAQRAQGKIVERKLCTTLDDLARLRPPAGNPATNPSRAFDQQLHAVLAQLGGDVGCR